MISALFTGLFAGLLSAALVSPAAAQDATPSTEAPASFTTSGELRYLGVISPDFVVDNEGNSVGQGFVLDQRLRVGLGYDKPRWSLAAEGDLFSGQLLGDTWDLEGTTDERHRESLSVIGRDSWVPRQAYGTLRLDSMQLDAGLMTSHWGLGLLANDGAQDPFFGRSDFGDRVVRVRATTMPAPGLAVVAAADRVLVDDIARWADGQAAYQGVLATLYRPAAGPTLGAYGVYRHQREADRGRRTNVGVLDLFVDYTPIAGPWELRIRGEGVGIYGKSDRSLSYNERDALTVLSSGVTGIASLTGLEQLLTIHLRGGWASGDSDPYDDKLTDFTADRDFDVGMVLFDELMGGLEVGAHNQLSDPGNAGQPPDGVEALLTEGSWRRSAFFQPVVDVRPQPWLLLRAGVVGAWSTGPILQPFTTFRAGGVPTNHLGEPTEGSSIGWEVDWAVAYQPELTEGRMDLRPELRVQGGHAFPDADLNEEALNMFMFGGRVAW